MGTGTLSHFHDWILQSVYDDDHVTYTPIHRILAELISYVIDRKMEGYYVTTKPR